MGKRNKKKKSQAARIDKPRTPLPTKAQDTVDKSSPQTAASAIEVSPKATSGQTPPRIRTELSILNPLLTGVVSIILLSTFAKYAPARPKETGEVIMAVLPILLFIGGAKASITKSTIERARTASAENVHATNKLLVRRTWYSALAIGVSLYPLLFLARFPELVARLVTNIVPRIATQLLTVLSQVATWIVAGLGGWLGNILLGVLGNLLYDVIKGRLAKRRNPKHGQTEGLSGGSASANSRRLRIASQDATEQPDRSQEDQESDERASHDDSAQARKAE